MENNRRRPSPFGTESKNSESMEKKKQAQPTHTQGKWDARGKYVMSGKKLIAQLGGFSNVKEEYFLSMEEAQANAKHIVKCVNTHSEAMDIILGLVRESKSGDTKIVKMAIDLLNRDKE
jgi:hypothetical protein